MMKMSDSRRQAERLCRFWNAGYRGSPYTFEVESEDGETWGVRQYSNDAPVVFWTLAQDSAGEWWASHACNMVRMSHIPEDA